MLLWYSKTYIQNPGKLLFWSYINEKISDLSKSVVFDPSDPRGAKMGALKLAATIEPGLPKDQVYNSEIAKNVASNPKGLETFFDYKLQGSITLKLFII